MESASVKRLRQSRTPSGVGAAAGYALLLSMVILLIISSISSVMLLLARNELSSSGGARKEVQAVYLAETGLDDGLAWFRNNYTLLEGSQLDATPATPPSLADPTGRAFTAPISLTNGSPLVLNGHSSGNATTHPASYTSVQNTSITDVVSSFGNALASQPVSLGAQNGTFSVMATLVGLSPERWRVDSIGSIGGMSKAASVYIERLPVVPPIQAAVTAGGPVLVTGNQSIDGRDHDENGVLIAGAPGLPGVMTTVDNPLPGVTGSGDVTSIVEGSPTVHDSSSSEPDPVPAGYPVLNTMSVADHPYSPATALGLDPAAYDPFLASIVGTTVPCQLSGLNYLDLDFPTGNPGGSCSYSGSGILIVHNPRYDPRYFDPANALYSSSSSPIAGQTAAQYRADTANRPRYFNYNANNTFKGIIIADSVGEVGTGMAGNAGLLGALISLDRVNGAVGSGNSTIKYSSPTVTQAIASVPYLRKRGTYRRLFN